MNSTIFEYINPCNWSSSSSSAWSLLRASTKMTTKTTTVVAIQQNNTINLNVKQKCSFSLLSLQTAIERIALVYPFQSEREKPHFMHSNMVATFSARPINVIWINYWYLQHLNRCYKMTHKWSSTLERQEARDRVAGWHQTSREFKNLKTTKRFNVRCLSPSPFQFG